MTSSSSIIAIIRVVGAADTRLRSASISNIPLWGIANKLAQVAPIASVNGHVPIPFAAK